MSEGDIVVIPGGVFHGWTAIPGHVTYLSIRPDPDKVLPAGWGEPGHSVAGRDRIGRRPRPTLHVQRSRDRIGAAAPWPSWGLDNGV